MRRKYPHIGVGVCGGRFGKTRNAFYDPQRRATAQALRDGLVLALVADIREFLPRLGTRKRQYLLVPCVGEYALRVGRDYLFCPAGRPRPAHLLPQAARSDHADLLALVSAAELDWPPERAPRRTGLSQRHPLRALTQRLELPEPDYRPVFSPNRRRLPAPDLSVRGTLAALQPTHTARTQPHRPLINHVDWGLPYAARAYVALRIAQRGDQYENAVAERVNGTPKDEFDLDSTLSGFAQVDTLVTCTVRVYNALLPHGSCDFLTPSQAHEQKGPLVRRWKNYYQPVDPAPTRRAVRAAE